MYLDLKMSCYNMVHATLFKLEDITSGCVLRRAIALAHHRAPKFVLTGADYYTPNT